MPILTNPRHEAFCQLRATGKPLEEAYELAGYKADRKNAQRLTTNDGVRKRIKEIQAKAVERHEVTIDTIASELEEDRAFAYRCENPNAAIAATLGKAKLFGLMTDRSTISVTHNYASMTEEELRFEIAAIHAEARALKAGVHH